MSVVVSLFLLSQVFLIISHGPLVHTLAAVILKSDSSIIENGAGKILEEYTDQRIAKPIAFTPPKESLEKSLESLSELHNVETDERLSRQAENSVVERIDEIDEDNATCEPSTSQALPASVDALEISIPTDGIEKIEHLNVTDEEKEQILALESPSPSQHPTNNAVNISTTNRPFLETIINSLHCPENDYATLFALCLLYALASNQVTTLPILISTACVILACVITLPFLYFFLNLGCQSRNIGSCSDTLETRVYKKLVQRVTCR